MENLKDKRTSVPGYILTLISVGLYLLDYFIEMRKEPNLWVLIGMFLGGFLLILAPRKFADVVEKLINGLINKFFPSKEENKLD